MHEVGVRPSKHMKTKKINNKIPVEWFKLLNQHPFFQDNSDAIPYSWSLCELIYKRQVQDDCSNKQEKDKYQVYSVTLQNFFRCIDVSYVEAIEALQDLGVISFIDRSYRAAEEKEFSKCRRYKLSDQIMTMMQESIKEYFLKLRDDPKFMRDENRNRNKRFKRIETIDEVCYHNSKNIQHLVYGLEELELAAKLTRANIKNEFQGALSDYELTTKTIQSTRRLYLAAERLRNDAVVTYSDVDQRLHTSYSQCPSTLRKLLKMRIGGTTLEHGGEIDLRACHPTFFALYVWEHLSGKDPSLAEEVEKWNAFWTGEKHPRQLIMDELGIDTSLKAEFKDALVAVLNDKHTITSNMRLQLRQWIAKFVPNLFSIWWKRSDILKHTGCNISAYYEKAILREPDLYNLAHDHGVVIMDVHDGIDVFCENKEEFGIISLILEQHIQNTARRMFNITPILTNK